MFVYLIHFNREIGNINNPHGKARHYIGSCDSIPERMSRHRSGNGSKIMAYLAINRISWRLAKVWLCSDRSLEKKLKTRKKSREFCPICRSCKHPNAIYSDMGIMQFNPETGPVDNFHETMFCPNCGLER